MFPRGFIHSIIKYLLRIQCLTNPVTIPLNKKDNIPPVDVNGFWRRAGEAGAGEPEGSGREAEASGLRFRMTQPGGALQRRARGLLPTEDHTLSLWGILSKETHHRPAEGARRGSEAMERLKYRPVPAHNPSPPSASHPFSQTPAKSPTAESVGQLSQDYF